MAALQTTQAAPNKWELIELRQLEKAEYDALSAMKQRQKLIEQAFGELTAYLHKLQFQLDDSDLKEQQKLLKQLELVSKAKLACYHQPNKESISNELSKLAQDPIIAGDHGKQLFMPKAKKLVLKMQDEIKHPQEIKLMSPTKAHAKPPKRTENNGSAIDDIKKLIEKLKEATLQLRTTSENNKPAADKNKKKRKRTRDAAKHESKKRRRRLKTPAAGFLEVDIPCQSSPEPSPAKVRRTSQKRLGSAHLDLNEEFRSEATKDNLADGYANIKEQQKQLQERMALVDMLFADLESYLYSRINSVLDLILYGTNGRCILQQKLDAIRELKHEIAFPNISWNGDSLQTRIKELKNDSRMLQTRSSFWETSTRKTADKLNTVTTHLLRNQRYRALSSIKPEAESTSPPTEAKNDTLRTAPRNSR